MSIPRWYVAAGPVYLVALLAVDTQLGYHGQLVLGGLTWIGDHPHSVNSPLLWCSFLVAATSNYTWNRIWTFRGTEGHAGFQAARFLAVSVGALVINLVVLYILADVAGLGDVPAQAIAVATAMPFNFLGNKLWTFR